MESPHGAEAPQTPPGNGRHTSYSSDNSTVCGSELEKDLESQTVKPMQRSFSQLFALSSPVSANLDDIDEEDLADSEDEETADVNALDYQRSALMNQIRSLSTDATPQSTTTPTATPASQPS